MNTVAGSEKLGVAGLSRYLAICVVVIVLDQWTKAIAVEHIAFGERIAVFPYFFWTMAYNTGVAFSLFADGESWQRYGLSAFALIVSGVFAWMMTTLHKHERLTAVAYALIIGGALGNVIDRIRLGHVVDFILLYYNERWQWPAFNIADSCIVIGAAILLIWGWRQPPADAATKTAP